MKKLIFFSLSAFVILGLFFLVAAKGEIISQAAKVLLAQEKYYFIEKWGVGTFSEPIGLAAPEPNKVWVADSGNNRVVLCTRVSMNIWDCNTLTGQFNNPTDVAVSPDKKKVCVADSGNHQIQIFSTTKSDASANDYALSDQAGGYGTGIGQFKEIFGVAFDSVGNFIYVSDKDNNRIQVYDVKQKNFDSPWLTGMLYNPRGIAVDSDGNVYVADYVNQRIVKLNSQGVSLKVWGSAAETNAGTNPFHYPSDIAVDSSKNVYVTNGNAWVVKINPQGLKIASFGGLGPHGIGGDHDGEFALPLGIAVDSAGSVYVSDATTDKIQKFRKGIKVMKTPVIKTP